MPSYKVKLVKEIKDKGYPTADKAYPTAHAKALKAEKKLDPKMYKAENKAERKLKPHTLMASHDKKGNVMIEVKYKRFKKDLVKHERTEWKADPGKK